MCTIGAIILGEEEYLLFKNKDFARPKFNDRIVSNKDWFGPQGLETFSQDPSTPDVYSGLSIGANKHGLLACVNHVKITDPEHANYDILVELVLSEARDVESAKQAIEEYLANQACWWGNVVLTDGKSVAAVEVRDQEMRVEENDSRIVRANHQPMFGEKASSDGIKCSDKRFFSADLRVGIIDSTEEVFEMLSAHDDGRTGICNHRKELSTVYSYVLHKNPDRTRIYLSQGQPCKSPRATMRVPLGKSWSPEAVKKFIARYPGGEAA